MNLSEMPRQTIPALPSATEKDQTTVNRKLIDTILMLYKRDEDKEKRLRSIEDVRGRGTTTNYINTTTDYDVRAFSGILILECNSPVNITVNLPKTTGSKSILIVSNANLGTVTVDGYGADTIMGDPTQQVLTDEGIIFVDVVAGRWIVT
jgi:hypothetical protein